MNYEENNIDWNIGDIVIHDADAKDERMLAKIVEKKETKQGIRYRILYFNKENNYERWWNSIRPLHDTKRFGIDISKFIKPNKEE